MRPGPTLDPRYPLIHSERKDINAVLQRPSPYLEKLGVPDHAFFTLVDIIYLVVFLQGRVRDLEAELRQLRPEPSYKEYLRSPEWREKAAEARARAGGRCQVCNTNADLQVHHRTYERLRDELPEDLTVLCHACHEVFHRSRRLSQPGV